MEKEGFLSGQQAEAVDCNSLWRFFETEIGQKLRNGCEHLREFKFSILDDAAYEIAIRSRKTPRIANRLLKRVSDFALVEEKESIDLEVVKKALDRLKISSNGLDNTDIEYLMSIVHKFNGGPVGIESIASSIGEEATTIEDVIEPFLLQEGYIKRTSRGRIVTEKTYREFKINEQRTLFDFE